MKTLISLLLLCTVAGCSSNNLSEDDAKKTIAFYLAHYDCSILHWKGLLKMNDLETIAKLDMSNSNQDFAPMIFTFSKSDSGWALTKSEMDGKSYESYFSKNTFIKVDDIVNNKFDAVNAYLKENDKDKLTDREKAAIDKMMQDSITAADQAANAMQEQAAYQDSIGMK